MSPQPAIIREEQDVIFIDTTTQTEAWTSNIKETQKKDIFSHNVGTKTSLLAKYIILYNDPTIMNLQEE